MQFDWGLHGAGAHAADITVVVDVLSFTTTLSLALDAGTVVLPCRWDDESALAFAADHDAVLAVARSVAGPGRVSLSPQSFRAGALPARVVLPSPNGSAISHHLGAHSAPCLGACLRNARAVAEWVAASGATSVAVTAAGERWPDESLRPAVEDLWGAGAVIAGLAECGWSLSPEADTARAGYEAVRGRERAALLAGHSGVELVIVSFSRPSLGQPRVTRDAPLPQVGVSWRSRGAGHPRIGPLSGATRRRRGPRFAEHRCDPERAPRGAAVTYADASALMKLLISEPETAASGAWLEARSDTPILSSQLTGGGHPIVSPSRCGRATRRAHVAVYSGPHPDLTRGG